MGHVGGVEDARILEVLVDGEEVLPQVLRALEVLQDPGQLQAALPVLPHSRELSLRGRLASPAAAAAARLSLVVEDDDLVHVEYREGAGNLTGEVRPQLRTLGVVQDGTWEGHAHGVTPALADAALFDALGDGFFPI